jgi:hypothetical protein
MTWLNYRDGSIAGPMARLFEVHEIPCFFFIDAEGVLQYERIGDGLFNKKLKQQVDLARQSQSTEKAARKGGNGDEVIPVAVSSLTRSRVARSASWRMASARPAFCCQRPSSRA